MNGGISMRLHPITKRGTSLGCSLLVTASLLSILPSMPAGAASQLCINEVCTKNATVAAPDGEYYDYVELYNPTSNTISLSGYGLSDDETTPYAYQFPSGTSIAAHGYLTIYCGVKSTPSGFLGAEFGLAKDGETVILSSPSGIAERMEIPPMQEDTAYARIPDGGDSFAELTNLTPGTANPQSADTQIVINKPQFSQGSGFYSSGFSLSLSAQQGCTIYYTTDGSDPTTQSTVYTSPIQVYDKSSEANVYSAITNISPSGYTPPAEPVKKAMIVRAIAVDSQGRVSDIQTNSYFIGYTSQNYETQMRVISLVTDPSNLFDDEKGIYVLGNKYQQQTGGMPGGMFGNPEANYTQSGREWERPANFTVFEKGVETFSADVGIRIHGAYTRQDSQKSFNIYARSDYGPTKLNYDFFNGTLRNINGKVIDSFDSMTLRTGANDKDTKIRDRMNQELVSDRDIAMLAQTECIVFLDGEYWGVYNLMEKISKDYISDHFKVKAGDVCIIKTDELTDGSDAGWADYEALKAFAESANFSNAADVDKFNTLCDAKSFADYMASELILGNSDFGNNNYSLWKTETVNTEKTYADGKWRFILFDTEYGQGLYGQSNANTNAFQPLRSKNTWLTKLFFGLLENDAAFRQLFVTCYYDLCNENFSPSVVQPRLTSLLNVYQPIMPDSLKRFANPNTGNWGGDWGGDWGNIGGDWGNIGGDWGNIQQPVEPAPGDENTTPTQPTVDYAAQFEKDVKSIQDFWNNRSTTAKQHLVNYLGNKVTNTSCTVQVTNHAQQGSVLLNTLTLPYNAWSGTYLSEMPIELNAEVKAGYRFAGWQVTGATFASGNASSINAVLTPTASTVTIQPTYSSSTAGYNQSDVRTLLAYLTGQTTLNASLASEYDLDQNGKLTATDLTLLKRQVIS